MKYFIIIAMCLISGNLWSQHIVVDGIPRDTSFAVYSTWIKHKKSRDYIKIVEPSLPQGVKAIEGVVYSAPKTVKYPDRKLKLNIYRPDDAKNYPAMLMVHGGGWNSGNMSLQIPMAQQIAAKGYVTIPVEYRLSPEAIYPAAVHDLKAAVRWVRENASKYGINADQIAISGCSAGGQLAMLIGTTNGQPEYEGIEDKDKDKDVSSTVQAIINIDGISDFTVKESLDAVRATLLKNKVSASVKWFGVTFDENKKPWIEASSLYHVTDKSAPVCFINSSISRFHDGRDEIIVKLNTYNIYSEVHTLPDTPHPFWLFDPWFDTTVELMTNFLNKQFK